MTDYDEGMVRRLIERITVFEDHLEFEFKCGLETEVQMLQNNVEMDLKMRLIESGQTQTEVAEKLGVSLSYVNRITKGREQIVNKTFVKMMDELGYDVELTYKKKAAD